MFEPFQDRSNAAVTLHFEDLAVQNYFKKELLINVKFFFLTILKTTHNSVREKLKNALSRTMIHLVFKIFKRKNFTFIKSAFVKSLKFFTNKCTHLLKTSIFGQ